MPKRRKTKTNETKSRETFVPPKLLVRSPKRNEREQVKHKILISLVILVSFAGCAKQITPQTNVAHYVSYDPKDTLGHPTSGIIKVEPSGGRLVTLHVRDRYNSLIDSYGNQFQPPLKHNDGITCSSTCSFNRAYYIKYLQMVQWQRDGRPITKKGWFHL